MKRTKVNSSAVISIGYNLKKRMLEIEYEGGNVYRYYDVPEEEYISIMKADSIGTYVNMNIKDGYEYERIK